MTRYRFAVLGPSGLVTRVVVVTAATPELARTRLEERRIPPERITWLGEGGVAMDGDDDCCCEFSTCGGLGVLECDGCGGDLCVCQCGGELECWGCADCLDGDSYDDREPADHHMERRKAMAEEGE